MRDSRDGRNYGCGRRLESYRTRQALAERTVAETGRGFKSIEQTRSGLASLAEALKGQGVACLERATAEHLLGWARGLMEQLADDEIARATTSTYISAVNQTMRVLGRYDLILSAQEFCLSRGQKWTNADRSNETQDREHFRTFLLEQSSSADGELRLRFLGLYHSVGLQEGLGLRMRESALIKLADKEIRDGQIVIGRADGTKNGRKRALAVLNSPALMAARRFVIEHSDLFGKGSLFPAGMSWREYRSWSYSVIDAYRMAYPENARYRYHGNRHYYAQQRFRTLFESRTGVCLEPPSRAGLFGSDWIRDAAARCGQSRKELQVLDREIRLEISRDLGHGRIEVTNSYLGR